MITYTLKIRVMTDIYAAYSRSGGRIEVTTDSLTFFRGKKIISNIPNDYEDKIKDILNNPNTKIKELTDY